QTNLEGNIAMPTHTKQRAIRDVQRLARDAQPLGPAHQPGPGRGHRRSGEPRIRAGTRAYWLAPIARGRPGILRRQQAGEFTSVRDAAREAGIVREVSLVEQVLRLWAKATPEERRAILDHIASE